MACSFIASLPPGLAAAQDGPDKPPVIGWNQLSVAYTNVKGDTLTATWNPPKYDVPDGKENDPKGERVLVRPNITVNGSMVRIDGDFINGKAVMKSPSVELGDRVLRLQTPPGRLEAAWRSEYPAITGQ